MPKQRLPMQFLMIAMLVLGLMMMPFSSTSVSAQEGAEEGVTEEQAPEPVDEASPTAEPVDEVTPTDEPVDEASPTAEPVDEASPTAEPVDEASPTTEPTPHEETVPTPESVPSDEAAPTDEPTPAVEEAAPTDEPTPTPTEEIIPTATVTPTVVVTEDSGDLGAQILTNIPFTSRVAVMDASGSGANFSFQYADESTSAGGGGADRGGGVDYSVTAYQMRIIDQANDTSITGGATLKGSAIVQSDNPIAAAVQFGGISGGRYQFEAYESGGNGVPDTKFFLPNTFKNVPFNGGALGASQNKSEIAIMNTDETTPAVVTIHYVTDNVDTTVTVAPGATYYHNLENDANVSTTTSFQPATFTSNGPEILVIQSQFGISNAGVPVLLTHTPGFRESDASSRVYLPNISARLTNGNSIVHTFQNIGPNPINVTVTYITDPACSGCPTPAPITQSGLASNAAFAVNPRVGQLPTAWFGSAIATVSDGSNSLVAFTNQININSNATTGTVGRNALNSSDKVLCPFYISGLPAFNASSQGGTLQVQNVSGTNGVQVRVTFLPGVSSPSTTAPAATTFTLNDGERRNFNNRLQADGGVPNNWFGSALVESLTAGADLAATVQLSRINSTNSDFLSAYNCVSP